MTNNFDPETIKFPRIGKRGIHHIYAVEVDGERWATIEFNHFYSWRWRIMGAHPKARYWLPDYLNIWTGGKSAAQAMTKAGELIEAGELPHPDIQLQRYNEEAMRRRKTKAIGVNAQTLFDTIELIEAGAKDAASFATGKEKEAFILITAMARKAIRQVEETSDELGVVTKAKVE